MEILLILGLIAEHLLMRKTLCLFAFLLAWQLSGCQKVIAQDRVTGIVVDSASLTGLASVNIQVKHTTRGTMTDERGNFAVEAAATDTLVFTLVGYQSLELPLATYEPGMIRLSEKYTLLQAVTIDESRRKDLYDGMFDDQNAQRKRSIPFYFSKAKKEKIKVEILKEENLRVSTYVEVVVKNPEVKTRLMKKHSLTEDEYYNVLRAFNEQHHLIMYYLTPAELISLLNTFFDAHAP